ncbi:MAG: hypothetical protein KKC19_01580 [Nanoarchaeota archaeon]|nr:hypothetical protein [Nanoarchaeota archaeon]
MVMNKRCIYCKIEIPQESVIDFCSRCGIGVWGEKMFNAIVKNMEEARSKGDLVSTNIGDNSREHNSS